MAVDYVPGRRNIGPHEVRRRRRSGLLGAAVSLVLLALLVWLEAPPLARLALFVPILIGTLGFVQSFFET